MRAVFSLLVCETQTTWSAVDSVNSRSLLVMIDDASAKPKSCRALHRCSLTAIHHVYAMA